MLYLRQGPLDVLPSLQPQALSPVSGLISGETDREPQKRRSQYAHEIISQVLPTGTLRRPTPSLTPIWLTAPPTHALPAPPVPWLGSLPWDSHNLHKGRGLGKNCTQVTEQQAPRIL